MPKRVPVQTIILHRDGKQISPPIGKTFDFTQAELDDINEVNKDAVRKPVVEDEKASEDDVRTGTTDNDDESDLSEAKAKADADAAKAKSDQQAAAAKSTTTAKTPVASKTASKSSDGGL